MISFSVLGLPGSMTSNTMEAIVLITAKLAALDWPPLRYPIKPGAQEAVVDEAIQVMTRVLDELRDWISRQDGDTYDERVFQQLGDDLFEQEIGQALTNLYPKEFK